MSLPVSRSSSIRIGVGAGTADDRIHPAVQLAQHGDLDYLVFECLAERTVARENLARTKDPERGYTPRLLERIEAVLPLCLEKDIRIVTNMGAANPRAGARAIRRLGRELGVGDVSCAIVTGDDVSDLVRTMPELRLIETGAPLESILSRMASANAYLGADVVARALATGASIVITGRVSDPSLFLAPALHEFAWSYDDWPRLAAGLVAGHLLECSSQVNGGCFADPGKKEVEDLATLGYPFADISADAGVIIGKLDSNGGRLDLATCTEQLLYEIHDPANYVTPDCVVDITDVRLEQVARDRVAVLGPKGRQRTPTYKVTIGYFDGYIGEGQVSFGGPNAVARAKLGAEVVQARLKERGLIYPELQVDLIGYSSVHGELPSRPEPYEVRLRIAARTDDRRAAEAVGFETRALHMHGPAGAGGGSDPMVREILAVQSLLLPRELVSPEVGLAGQS
ncbi:MAG: acyclic terpene utilization AtuA family protein [Hyphomicrobiaceae bacterium]